MSNPPSAPAPLPGTASILPTNRACNGCSTAKVACAKSTGPDARCTRCEEKDVDCAYRPRKRPDLHATIDRLTAEKAELIARHVQEIAEKDDLIARLRAEVAQSQSTSRRPWTTVETGEAQDSGGFTAQQDPYRAQGNVAMGPRYWSSGNLINDRAPSMMAGFTAANGVASGSQAPFQSSLSSPSQPAGNGHWNAGAATPANYPSIGVASSPSFTTSPTSPSSFNPFLASAAPSPYAAFIQDNGADGPYLPASDSNNYDATLFSPSDLLDFFSPQ